MVKKIREAKAGGGSISMEKAAAGRVISAPPFAARHSDTRSSSAKSGQPERWSIPGGGRTWWAHFKFTRINITPTFLPKKIEDVREARA